MTETPANPAAWVAYDAALEAGWERVEPPRWGWRHLRHACGCHAWIYVDGGVDINGKHDPGVSPCAPRTPDDWRDIAARWSTLHRKR